MFPIYVLNKIEPQSSGMERHMSVMDQIKSRQGTNAAIMTTVSAFRRIVRAMQSTTCGRRKTLVLWPASGFWMAFFPKTRNWKKSCAQCRMGLKSLM